MIYDTIILSYLLFINMYPRRFSLMITCSSPYPHPQGWWPRSYRLSPLSLFPFVTAHCEVAQATSASRPSCMTGLVTSSPVMQQHISHIVLQTILPIIRFSYKRYIHIWIFSLFIEDKEIHIFIYYALKKKTFSINIIKNFDLCFWILPLAFGYNCEDYGFLVQLWGLWKYHQKGKFLLIF